VPKIVDHEARRVEYAEAAMRIALKGGVESLTVRAVSAEAGCSTGALAHYYKSKDDLLIAVQRAASRQSLERIDSCFSRFEGPQLLEEVILSALPLDEERRGEWRLWLAYFARAAQIAELASVQRSFYESWYARLRTAYLEARADATPKAVRRAVDASMTLVQGLGVLGMYGPAEFTPRRQQAVVREHLERWLRA
jgi:AcrR family transcriptional regulator